MKAYSFLSNITFKPKLHITLATLLATILFLSLGIWQLMRADEKKTRATQATLEEHKAPKRFYPHPHPYERLKLKGHYQDEIILLDNQHEQHQLGYHVLTPFALKNNTVVLIDRGWIARDETHNLIPNTASTTLVGHAYYPSSKQWVLGDEIEIKSNKMAISQTINVNLFSHFLQKPVYPFIIRLNAQEPEGFVRHWIINNMPWQRHIAYAIQWFCFAMIVLALYLIRNIKYEKK